jgi:hypothetical protein
MNWCVSTTCEGRRERVWRDAALALLIAGGLLRLLISCRDIEVLDTLFLSRLVTGRPSTARS